MNKLNSRLNFITTLIRDIKNSDDLSDFSLAFNLGKYLIRISSSYCSASIDCWTSYKEDHMITIHNIFPNCLELMSYIKSLKD